MAETSVVTVENNGFRNAIVRATFVSADGSGITNQKIFDATSGGAFGVVRGGQTFYPGVNTCVWGLDYDVQDVKVKLQWEATANVDITPLGSAPEDFDWRKFGGIKCPRTVTGVTGSILLSTVNCAPGSTFFIILYLWKGVPQT